MQVTKHTYDPNIDDNLFMIHSNYFEILSDDDPILYTGTSIFSNRIVGSIIEDNYEGKYLRYFHAIVLPNLYIDFTQGKITLNELYKNCNNVYIVDFNYDGTIRGAFPLRFANVPSEWLPLKDSFCPPYLFPKTLEFSTSLTGALANENKARPSDATNFYKFTSTILNGAADSLAKLNYSLEPFYEPAKAGSYKLDFKFVIKSRTEGQIDFTESIIDEDLLSSFIEQYLDVIINKLPEDSKNSKIEENQSYISLVEKLKQVYEDNSRAIDEKTVEKLKKSVINVLRKSEELTKSFGKGFEAIEFNSYDSHKVAHPIANMNRSYYTKVNKFIPIDILQEDKNVQSFSIRVFDINTETLHCRAYANYTDGNGINKTDKVTIKHNLEHLTNTQYSNSLNKKQFFTIKGVGQYDKKGRLKFILVE